MTLDEIEIVTRLFFLVFLQPVFFLLPLYFFRRLIL